MSTTDPTHPSSSPLFTYDLERSTPPGNLRGAWRQVSHRGRTGVHLTSKHARLELPGHTLAGRRGAAALWFMPLEDMTPMIQKDPFAMHDPLWHSIPLLIDSADQVEESASRFALAWNVFNSPGFYARFYSGYYHHQVWSPVAKAFVRSNGASFFALHWYQVVLSWDHDAKEYGLYINGVQAGDRNRFPEKGVPEHLFVEPAHGTVFTGNPKYAVSSVHFYGEPMEAPAVQDLYRAERREPDEEEDLRVAGRHGGHGLPPFSFNPDSSWKKELTLSLTEPSHLKEFYVQGMEEAPRIEGDGLHIETRNVNQPMGFKPGQEDKNQVYLWSERTFEGDLYLSFEWKSLLPGGLSLLMLQSSGMQREDFMADYPRRTDGSMKMVSWEDVRNYQWEYYREMNDTRNDTATHYFKKNPAAWLMAYQDVPGLLSDGAWHRLEYLQIGGHIHGAIDRTRVFDVMDDSRLNNGPVLSFGRLAIRCMLRTHMVFRNLQVMNRRGFEVLPLPGKKAEV